METNSVPLSDGALGADYRLRPAGRSDLSRLVELEKEAQPAPWPASVFARELELDWSKVWVVESNRRVIAFLVYWHVGLEFHLMNVVVAPAMRRRGLAKGLVVEMQRVAALSNVETITLEVRVSNEAAIRLYRSLGFDVLGVRRGYYQDTREDATVMAYLVGGSSDSSIMV